MRSQGTWLMIAMLSCRGHAKYEGTPSEFLTKPAGALVLVGLRRLRFCFFSAGSNSRSRKGTDPKNGSDL